MDLGFAPVLVPSGHRLAPTEPEGETQHPWSPTVIARRKCPWGMAKSPEYNSSARDKGSWSNGLAAARQQRKKQNCSKKIVVIKSRGALNEVWLLILKLIIVARFV